MRILILGGTRFLGRHLVEAALGHGHELTLFTRGQSGPDLFPDVEHLRGNRDPNVAPGLAPLEGHRWDAVIDTSGYVPRIVRAGAEALSRSATHYTFISSISAYRDFAKVGIDETYPTGTLEDETVEQVTGETYGPLKALCERAAQETFPGRALVIRPGLIVGPHDPTDRFTYWPVRVARGGEVLAPNGPHLPTQIVDARDLAEWTIREVERFADGVFNATGPERPLTLGEVLQTAKDVGGSDATFTWVQEPFLLEREVAYWQHLPAILPETDPSYAGMSRIDVSKAVESGLTFRPLAATVADTLAWHATRPADHTLRAGLTPEREAELLREWHARGGT